MPSRSVHPFSRPCRPPRGVASRRRCLAEALPRGGVGVTRPSMRQRLEEAVPFARRKRHRPRRAVARACPGAERSVRGAAQGHVPAWPISAAQSAPGPGQGHRGRGGRHAESDLRHARARGGLSGSWPRPPSAPRALSSRRSPGPKARRTRLRVTLTQRAAASPFHPSRPDRPVRAGFRACPHGWPDRPRPPFPCAP